MRVKLKVVILIKISLDKINSFLKIDSFSLIKLFLESNLNTQ